MEPGRGYVLWPGFDLGRPRTEVQVVQQLPDSCPRCDQPLGISWDMWGKYYLCGGCGFTAEDDDELNGKSKKPPPGLFHLIPPAPYRPWQASSRR